MCFSVTVVKVKFFFLFSASRTGFLCRRLVPNGCCWPGKSSYQGLQLRKRTPRSERHWEPAEVSGVFSIYARPLLIIGFWRSPLSSDCGPWEHLSPCGSSLMRLFAARNWVCDVDFISCVHWSCSKRKRTHSRRLTTLVLKAMTKDPELSMPWNPWF